MHKIIKSKVCKPNDNGIFSDISDTICIYVKKSVLVPNELDNSLHSRTVNVVSLFTFSERPVQVKKC